MKTPHLTLILVTIAILSTFAELTPRASATIFKSHGPIHISGNENFTQINGVTGGSGTPSDPYTIEGWEINTADKNGIEIYNSSVQFIIRNLNIRSNFLGILLQNVSSGTLEDITISDSETAIQLSNCNSLTISGNKLLNSQNGIFILLGSTNITVSGNTILSNTSYGMYLFLTTRVTVYHNNFVNNTFQARDLGTSDSWNASYPLGGNYWSDYTGVDKCSGPQQNICTNPDGIGDTPYAIEGGAVDNYPLIKPFDMGPPSWPEGSSLTATVVRPTSITLVWSSATDDTVVIRYRLLLGDNVVAMVPWTVTSYNITGLQPNTMFTVHLQAEDLAHVWSSSGPSTNVKTPAIQPNNVQNAPSVPLTIMELGLALLVAAVIAVSAVVLVVRRGTKVRESTHPTRFVSLKF